MPDISFEDFNAVLDTFGDPKDYLSNAPKRQGNRSKKVWAKNLSDGVKRQVAFGEDWFDSHQKLHPDFPVEFLNMEVLDREGKIDEGNFRDGLDAILTVKLKEQVKDILIELDCVEYNTPFGRFKQRKIHRNLNRSAPIVYGHTGYGTPRLYIFSQDILTEMDREENYMTNDSDYRGPNPDGVYDGHPYYKLDVRNSTFPWINALTLSPEATYKVLIKNLLSRKKKGE